MGCSFGDVTGVPAAAKPQSIIGGLPTEFDALDCDFVVPNLIPARIPNWNRGETRDLASNSVLAGQLQLDASLRVVPVLDLSALRTISGVDEF